MVRFLLAPLGWNEEEEPLCIAFTNTVGVRRSSSPNEYLRAPSDLDKWIAARKLGPASSSATTLDRAIGLRNAIYGILSPIAAGASPPDAAIAALNRELHAALDRLRVSPQGWTLDEEPGIQRFLMLVALSAAELLTSDRLGRVRECADAECGWLFIDSSKNRSRRWCSMSDCGNLAKARRFQAKKRGQRMS